MKFDIRKLNGGDLSKVIYPIIILLTGLYIIPNVYRLFTEWNWGPIYILYTAAFTLIPIGFIYLALKKVKLEFKWSFLSVVGIILIIIFIHEVTEQYYPGAQLLSFFLTEGWDHISFPIAFGFFFLCDMDKIPKKFWFFLLPFGLLAFSVGNINVIANIFFEKQPIIFGAPSFFGFFKDVNSWEGLRALPNQEFIFGLREFLHEFLTFFTLFPVVIFYYLFKNKKISQKGQNQQHI